jgi:hypothetical protein
MHRLILALVAILALALAACSSPGTSASSSASAAPSSASDEASPSEAASESESAEASASEIAIPSIELPSSAPELEAVLPDEVGGVQLQKLSMQGAEFMQGGQADEEFLDFLDRLGAEPDDVSVALAFGFDVNAPESGGVSLFAFRVAGADTDKLTDELKTSLESEGDAADWSESNVGGKDVLVGESTDEDSPGQVYLYGVGDIVFFIGTTSQDDAVEVLSQLP